MEPDVIEAQLETLEAVVAEVKDLKKQVCKMTCKEIDSALTLIGKLTEGLKSLREDIKDRIVIEKMTLDKWELAEYDEKTAFKSPEHVLACWNLLKDTYGYSDAILIENQVLVMSVAKSRDLLTKYFMDKGETEDEGLCSAKGVLERYHGKPDKKPLLRRKGSRSF